MEVFHAGGRTYAITAAPGDDGMQIMDITDPVRPVPVSAIFDDAGGFGALDGATDVGHSAWTAAHAAWWPLGTTGFR